MRHGSLLTFWRFTNRIIIIVIIMHDILSPKRMCTESRDLFKYWEIIDNTALTVQD